MTTAVKGVFKILTVGEEATFGTIADNGDGRILRRVNGALQLTADPIRSQEIVPSQQVQDADTGVERAVGSLSGQLSCKTFDWAMEAVTRNRFTASAATGTLTNVTAAAGPPGTFTRAAGSFIDDGFKVGDVVRWTGWTSGGAGNNSRNYRIQDLTDLVMTASGQGNEAVAARVSGDSVTCALVGKKTWIPESGHELLSFSFEQWFPDGDPDPISERFTGVRVSGLRINAAATGYIGVEIPLIGQAQSDGTTQYFQNPQGVTSTRSLKAVGGKVRFNGKDVSTVTGVQLSIASQMEGNPVMGTNTVPDIFPGVLIADGQLAVYVKDQIIQQAFRNGTEVDLHLYFTESGSLNSHFLAIVMNRVRLFSATKNDSPMSIIQNCSFQALEHVEGAGDDTKFARTTISIQDSTL